MLFVGVYAYSQLARSQSHVIHDKSQMLDVLRERIVCFSWLTRAHNGPQFVSEEFETFVKQNGIKHVKSAPYNPG